jgi:uncharacterized cupredoxin-like copper-binding protein
VAEQHQSRRAQRSRQKQVRARNRLLAMVGGVAVVLAVVLVIVLRDPAPAAPVYAGTTLDLQLGDYFITGATVPVTAPAGPVRIHAVNVGGLPHNVGVRRVRISGEITRNEELTLDLGTLTPGTYEMYCDIPGHVEAGMVAPLVITEASAVTSTADGT